MGIIMKYLEERKNEGKNEHHFYEIFRRKEGRKKEGMKGW